MKPTITFYEVDTDVELYQYFLLDEGEQPKELVSDGRPWKDIWQPPTVFSFQPRLREGDFWNFGLGAFGTSFAVRPESFERTGVAYYLEGAGELLPLPYQGREFKVLNITECIDALDRERTVWYDYQDLDPAEAGELADEAAQALAEAEPVVDKPAFRLDRLGWQLYKLPETAITKIYYWEHSGMAEEQFRLFCEREGLKGLIFTPIYSTESPW